MSRDDKFQRAFFLLLVIAISAAFLSIIRHFLLVILLAAVFAGVAHPLYEALLRRFRGRATAASLVTVLLLFVLVAGPVATMATVVVNQAIQVSENIRPRVEQLVKEPTRLDGYLQRLPFHDHIAPYRTQILTTAGELVGSFGSVIVRSIGGTIGGTVVFFVQLVMLMYTMFFLLRDGRRMLDGIRVYLPLSAEDKERMIDRFVSVTRATLKGTVLIGFLQGVLSGLAFWAVGIQGAVFWGTLMTLLSIIPGVGGALVWVPAVLVLLSSGHAVKALLLAAFCGLVVGSVDNLLRPQLVGRDTKLHELLIFFSTIGGLIAFGPMGFIVGPIIAALFVTVWEIFGVVFRTELTNTPAQTD